MTAGLAEAGIPAAIVQVAPDSDRAYVAAMLAGADSLDLIIPRGGRSLVERVQREARVPVLAHAQGMNHLFVHAAADPAMAATLLANSKMRRPGVCGATETLLIDSAATAMLPGLVQTLSALGCRFRADAAARAVCPDLPAAEPGDFDTEWQDAVLNVAVVDGVGGRARPYRRPWQRAHRRHRDRGRRRRRAVPGRRVQRRGALERLHPVLRRR